MDEQRVSKAFDAIHDEAMKLLALELPSDVRTGIDRIVALARYQFDVRPPSSRTKHDEAG